MKDKIVLIVVMIVLMTSIQLNLGQVHAQKNTNQLTLDQQMTQVMKDYKIPGAAIAIIEHGEIISIKAYGDAKVDEKIPMEITTICRTQSISKSITAWGIMTLVEAGQIALDDPVTNYLTDDLSTVKDELKNVTIRQLLSNNAGLSTGTVGVHYDPRNNRPTLRENLLNEIEFIEQPNTTFVYSNTGFNLLELVIEKVTNEAFDTYMTREVLVPLQMTDARFEMTDKILAQLPYGYDLKNTKVLPYVYPAKASGGLYATVGDLAQFLTVEMTNYNDTQVLAKETIELMQTPQVDTSGIYSLVADDYGLGHFIEYFDNKKAVFHGGQGHGWMTHYHFVPEDGNGIVLLTNSQRSWPLISIILKQWSQHYGYDLKMSRITVGITLLKGIVLLLLGLTGWQLLTIVKHKNNQILEKNTFKQLLQVIMATIILFVLLWSFTLEYVFIEAVFPKMYQWLRLSLLLLSMVMILDYILINKQQLIL